MSTQGEILLGFWQTAMLEAKEAAKARYEVETQIVEWMRDNRAEQIEADGVVATFRPEIIYDYGVLAGLAEVMAPEEFMAILTNPKPPEPRVNVVEAKKWAKKGEPWRSIVERAAITGLPVLKIKEGK